MASKKKQRSIKPAKKNNSFKITAGILITALIIFFAVSQLINNSDNNEKVLVKKYTSIDFVKQGELTFTTSDSEYISKIDIEIADDDNSRVNGLKYRTKMAESQGMFFIFPFETVQSFWMQYTVLSLDMIFVNKENIIVKIRKKTIPYDENSYTSEKPATYVVEVNADYTDKFGIKEGDKIVWRRN